ncbi:MAG: DNA repair protein RecO [Bacillota bacterium]
MLLKTEGVVLKQNKFGEGDAILTIFSRKMGKIQGVAKGAYRQRGKYSLGAQVFSYGEFVLFKGKELYQISQIDIKQSFYKLRENVDRLAYASYILELTGTVITEGQTNNRLFETLLRCLQELSTMDDNFQIITKAFELKLLNYSGLKPVLDKCVQCGKEIGESAFFHPEEGGVLCGVCCEEGFAVSRISKTTLNVMNYLLETDFSSLKRLRIKEYILLELEKIMRQYIGTHLERTKFNSLDFLNLINNNSK